MAQDPCLENITDGHRANGLKPTEIYSKRSKTFPLFSI